MGMLLDLQLNRRAYLVSVVATIFVPLTFITGFFGMNFGWMVDRIGAPVAFWLLGLPRPDRDSGAGLAAPRAPVPRGEGPSGGAAERARESGGGPGVAGPAARQARSADGVTAGRRRRESSSLGRTSLGALPRSRARPRPSRVLEGERESPATSGDRRKSSIGRANTPPDR